MPVYGVAEAHRRLGNRDQALRFYQMYVDSQAADASAALKREAVLWIQNLKETGK